MAIAATVWTVVLLVRGGAPDLWILGLRLRTSDPYRAFIVALVAIFVFAAAVGEGRTDVAMSGVLAYWRRLVGRLDDRVLATVLAFAMVVVGLRWGAKAVGGSDSYGYASQAELWLTGRLDIAQPWVAQVPWPGAEFTFSPLAYHPREARTSITPTYSAGLPLLMALAKRVAGPCAIFWVVPASGGVLVLATLGIGRRLHASRAGLVAAWLLATSPPFLYMLMMPMSDVPAAAAWAVTFWGVFGGTVSSAVGAGAAAAVAVLIRPNLVPLAGVAVLWFLLDPRQGVGADRRRGLWQAAAFLTGLSPGVVVTAALNRFWNGSPLTSGYGALADLFSLHRVLPNLAHYAGWLSQTQTPLAFLGIAALLVPATWLWPSGARRSAVFVLGLIIVTVWAEYCAYQTFGHWWDLRFLLPSWPFIMIGTAVVLLRVAGDGFWRDAHHAPRPLASVAIGCFVLLLGVHGVRFAVRERVLELQRGEAKYPVAAAMVAARTEANAVVFSGLHSGSLRYYAGRMTLTYFNLEPDWLDRATVWLDAHGAHPYALLENPELKEFRTRFSSNNRVGRLDMKPSVIYDGPAKIYLFDLLRSSGTSDPTDVIMDPIPTVRCVAPTPSPTLVLK